MNQPEHYAEFKTVAGDFHAEFQGKVIARSNAVCALQEFHPSYEFPPVYYFPRASIDFGMFTGNERHTSCPIKGEASYWDLPEATDVMWGYERPLPAAAPVKDHFAFDQSRGVALFRDGTPIEPIAIRKK
ncbi:MAG: DUF427 domain-containing protein [Leptospirales bacterium]|nr:DUF427 domain-containing protein [Leptospirales bacterium]